MWLEMAGFPFFFKAVLLYAYTAFSLSVHLSMDTLIPDTGVVPGPRNLHRQPMSGSGLWTKKEFKEESE